MLLVLPWGVAIWPTIPPIQGRRSSRGEGGGLKIGIQKYILGVGQKISRLQNKPGSSPPPCGEEGGALYGWGGSGCPTLKGGRGRTLGEEPDPHRRAGRLAAASGPPVPPRPAGWATR